jgi:hypothetical protein
MKELPNINGRQAFKIDLSFYSDIDDGDWGVFGDVTGFCYALPGDEKTANKIAKEMNEEKEAVK